MKVTASEAEMTAEEKPERLCLSVKEIQKWEATRENVWLKRREVSVFSGGSVWLSSFNLREINILCLKLFLKRREAVEERRREAVKREDRESRRRTEEEAWASKKLWYWESVKDREVTMYIFSNEELSIEGRICLWKSVYNLKSWKLPLAMIASCKRTEEKKKLYAIETCRREKQWLKALWNGRQKAAAYWAAWRGTACFTIWEKKIEKHTDPAIKYLSSRRRRRNS